jgi:hypothetical protein
VLYGGLAIVGDLQVFNRFRVLISLKEAFGMPLGKLATSTKSSTVATIQ